MRDEKIRHTLSERFADYGSEPSEGVWNAIEMHLDEDNRNSGTNGFKFLWWSLALIGLSFVSWGIVTNEINKDSVEMAVVSKKNEKIGNTKNAFLEVQKNSDGKPTPALANTGEEHEDLNSAIENDTKEKSLTEYSEKVKSKASLNSKSLTNTQENIKFDTSPQVEEIKEKSALSVNSADAFNSKEEKLKTETELLTSGKNLKVESNQAVQSRFPESIDDNKNTTAETPDLLIKKVKSDESLLQLTTLVAKELPTEGNTVSPFNHSHSPLNWLPPKWEMRIRLGTFKNIGNSSSPDSYLSPYTWQEINAPAPETHTQNYKRYGEFQIDAIRRIGRKFHLSAGLSTSYSQNKVGTIADDTLFTLNQISYGIPIEIGYTVVNYKRFAVKPYLGILNEVNNYLQGMTTSTTNGIIEETQQYNQWEIGYSFGLQPAVEIYYYMNEKTSLSLSCGYRKYIAGYANGQSPGLRQPDYFQTAIGISWILR
jgi:hypothetical protein